MTGPPNAVGRDTFDAWYYGRYSSERRPYCRDEHWLTFFGRIADRIASDIQPLRVLDVGCALGFLVEGLRERGVEAFGIDVSSFAIGEVFEPIKPFCREASATDDFAGDYDLITVIEVLEHMPAGEAERAIENICGHTNDVLFSSTPFDHREATHVNVRPPEYWAEQFARWGFYRDVTFDASFLTSWAVRFRKRDEPIHRIAADYERGLSQAQIERNELRTQALVTRRDLSEMAQRIDRAEADLKAARDECADARRALGEARATVAAMERSWFWRIRRVWVFVTQHLGRPA